MKKFRGRVIYPMILGLLAGCFLPVPVFAAPPTPTITGNWLGTLVNLRLLFIVSEKPDHSLNVILQSLDQGGSNIPTENATFKDKVFHFDSSVIQSSYSGKLSEDGAELEGYWTQNGTHPLTLKKIDKIPVVEYIPDAKDVDGLKHPIDQLVEPLIKGGWDKAMAVGVIYKGQTRVWGYGNAALEGVKVPDGDTEFEVGSITKIFTRLMFIDMIQKGEMKLDDPAQNYLPSGVKMPSYNGKQISLFHLAQHLAGLPHDPDDISWTGPDKDPQSKYTLQKLYAYLGRVKLTREPGVQAEYSNTGVALLGDLIVSKSGKSYEDYLQQLVCQPLGLKDTGVVWKEDQLARAAQGYDGTGNPTPLWKWTEPAFIGAGAIHSTANDMLKLAQDLFKPTTIEPLQKLTSYSFADTLGWGYFVTHDGQTTQFNSSFYVDRDNQWAVVVWGNRPNMKTSAVAAEIRKVVKGIKPIPLDLPEKVRAPSSKLKPFVGRYRVEQVDALTKTLAGKTYKIEAKKGHFVSTDETTNESSNIYLTAKGDLFNDNDGVFFSAFKDSQGEIVGVTTKPGQIYSVTLRKLDASGKPMEGPLLPKGKALDAPGGKLLVDNFESGKPQNLLGGSWAVQFDDHHLGTVLKDKDQFIVKGGPKGSSYCARIYGHFGFSRDPWPYVQLFTALGTQGPVDLSGFKAIEFMARGDRRNYEVMMNTPSVTDYSYFRVPFKASDEWTAEHMDLDSFNQPGWGKKVLRDFSSVSQILYQPSEMSDQDFDLWIDDVTLLK